MPSASRAASDLVADEGFLDAEHVVDGLDHGDLVGSEPSEGLGHLDADDTAAEDEQTARDLLGLGDVTVVPRDGVGEAVDRRVRGPGADADHHTLGRLQPGHAAVLGDHLDQLLAHQAPVATVQFDPRALEPVDLALVVPVGRERVAVAQHLLDVYLAGDRGRGGGHAAGGGEHLGGAQERLGRHAAPVAALTADQVGFDDGSGQAALVGRVGVLATSRRVRRFHAVVVRLANAGICPYIVR